MFKKVTLLTTVCFGLLFTFQSKVAAQKTNKNDKKEKILVSTTANNIRPEIITYPAPPGLETSPDFTVKVNNTNVWTESVGNGGLENLNVANFSCSGSQTVTVTASSEIKKYIIRPKSRGIVAQVNGRELNFTISGPQKLYIEIDSLPHLSIFANPVEISPPKKGDSGVVYYEPGTYNAGEINLQSNQTIYIAGGAVVNANIRGSNLQNVKVLGRGILNGNIRISGTSNLEVNGIFIRNTSGWSNTLTNCFQTAYNNVKVFSYRSVWGVDGINPVSCKNFLIDDCFIRTRDDCISIKSISRSGSDTIKNINTDSITVMNSVMVGWSHADGVTLGFELQGGRVENVLVKNCDILSARGQGRTGGHSGFSIVCDGPSLVRNIRFEDIRVEGEIEYKNLELIITEGRRYGTVGPGHINGVYLKNIHWENASKPFVIAGVPNNILENVTFDHCFLAGKLLTSFDDADFQMEFAKDINFIPTKID